MMGSLLQRAWERANWVTTRPFARALILVYHRVAEIENDPWSLAVPPPRFDEHMSLLRRCCEPLSLQQLSHGLRGGRVRDGGVVVTFDDGYADNLHNASPLLRKHGIPATLFVATAALEDPRFFWWDELSQLILGAPALPEHLWLRAGGADLQWSGIGLATQRPETEEATVAWKGWEKPVSGRQRLYQRLWRRLRELHPRERVEVLDRLAEWSGIGPSQHGVGRPLTTRELIDLAGSGHWDIGAHTVRHPTLAKLTEPDQRREIEQSRDALQELLGRRVSYFAYPFGGRADYGARAVRLVREAGYEAACSVATAPVTRFSSRHELPRIYAQDWTVAQLGRIVHHWLGVPVP